MGRQVGAKTESREELKGTGGGTRRGNNHYVLLLE